MLQIAEAFVGKQMILKILWSCLLNIANKNNLKGYICLNINYGKMKLISRENTLGLINICELSVLNLQNLVRELVSIPKGYFCALENLALPCPRLFQLPKEVKLMKWVLACHIFSIILFAIYSYHWTFFNRSFNIHDYDYFFF